MRKFFQVLFLLFLPILLHAQQKNGYLIDVTIRGLSDSAIYLGYHFGDKQYLKDTIKLDKAGKGVFTGNEALPQGIYLVVLPGKKYFEVLLSEDQNFSLDCSYNDYIGTLKFVGSTENTAFLAYQRKWVTMQQHAGSLSKRIQNNKANKDSLNILLPLQKSEEADMKAYL
ncbi:MAG: DUF4369 domain-containing protein, partial [Chloroflexota bacterium]